MSDGGVNFAVDVINIWGWEKILPKVLGLGGFAGFQIGEQAGCQSALRALGGRQLLHGFPVHPMERAFSQVAHVQLTKVAFSWLNQQLEQAFLTYGKLTSAELESLDWRPITTT